MKGRTNQPLRIWVDTPWRAHPAVLALAQQGHTVYDMHDFARMPPEAPDLILHPAAHGWCEAMFVEEEKKDGTKCTPYLDAALTAARKRKREAK